MVDNLWPADAVTGAPSYSGRMLRQAQGAFLAGATSARPLGARSGVRPGTPSTTVTATSSLWTCQAFGGVADVMTAGEAGPYAFAFDAVDTGAVTAAHATLPRVDIVYVAVEDPAEGIGSVPLVERRYLAGTAAASPVAPSIPVGERGFVIANLNVPASGGGAPSVTWVAPYTAGAGGVVPLLDLSAQTAWSPEDGAYAHRLDTGALMQRRGGVWRCVESSDSRNRAVAVTNTFTNPTAATDFPQAADKAALDMTFVKNSADTVLRVQIAIPFVFSSGSTQVLSAVINIDGTDYVVAAQVAETAPDYGTLVGVRDITGVGAGSLAVKPRVQSQSAAMVTVNATTRVSYTVTEV